MQLCRGQGLHSSNRGLTPVDLGEEDPLSRTVFLHVGVAKTGTTYLQRMLFANRDCCAAERPCSTPGASEHAHFQAALDLRGARFQGTQYPEAARYVGTSFVDQIQRVTTEPALISHEKPRPYPAATIQQARRTDFTTTIVQIVLITTRDLGRQIPAVWQENVKNRNDQTYSDFLQDDLRPGGHRRTPQCWRLGP